MKRWILAALAALLTAGCQSDGLLGDTGRVRFSFVGTDPGADDTAPVAANTTLRVLLQHPQNGGIDSNTFTNLSLEVHPAGGGDAPAVFPTGIAEYGVFFTKPGQYQLAALQDGAVLDTTTLTVVNADSLAFVPKIDVHTDGSTETCLATLKQDPATLSLASNQTATLFLVPMSGTTGLLGLPELTVDATNATLDTSPSSYAEEELNLDVSPTAPGAPVTVTATDLLNHLTAKVTIPVTTSAAGCP